MYVKQRRPAATAEADKILFPRSTEKCFDIVTQFWDKVLDICAKVLYNNIDLSMRLCT